MRIFLTLFILCLGALFSCGNRGGSPTGNNAHVPEAMQDYKEISFSKRGYDDYVNSIYNNLLEKSEELRKINGQMNGLEAEKNDSAAAFDEFIALNERYYASAELHINSIQDTQLKTQILSVINNNKRRLESSLASQKKFLHSIDSSIQYLKDHHEALKVLVTLPVIQEYQQSNVPPISPLQGLDSKLKKLKPRIDSILKKNGG